MVTALSNLSMAGWSAPLIFFFPGQPNASGFWGAILAGTALFLGRICAIRALSHGDLSHATPLLGTKTVFVAVLTSLFLEDPITPGLMAGAVLTSLAVALLSITPTPMAKSWWPRKFDRATTLWALLAAFFFALTDIVVQKFARLLGVGWFQPLMFSTLALLTPLLFISRLRYPSSLQALLPASSRPSTIGGSAVIGFSNLPGDFGHWNFWSCHCHKRRLRRPRSLGRSTGRSRRRRGRRKRSPHSYSPPHRSCTPSSGRRVGRWLSVKFRPLTP